MKRSISFNKIAARALLVIMVGVLVSRNVDAQGWLDDDWPSRRAVAIPNPSGTELSDFQVLVSLNNGNFDFSSALIDGSDIRVAASDGTTPVPYWIETWDASGQMAGVWVKVPLLPVAGTTVYFYYGNPAAIIPDPELIETPPAGPFTKHPGNPGILNGTGAPGETESILPENIVYDDVTQHYWMVLSDQTGGPYVGLVYSDDPTNPDAWYWSGYPITGNPVAIAPHLIEYNGTWYIFYGDRSMGAPYPISVATSSSVSGPYTKVTEVLLPGLAGSWEDTRVDEPYVFWNSSMSKWILTYMGDAGSNVEQIGYATADDILGPYTKYSGNPCIPFGPAGTYDAGTVADPWVYEYQGTYYIGHTVSPTTSSPWQTALASTTDWLTFTKHGIILPRGDEYNSFRGAVTRIGDQYVFPYTGGPAVGQYRFCIATQPVFQTSVSNVNDPDAVFDFYDGFEGSALDLAKWTLVSGSTAQTIVADGMLTMNATATYALLRSTTQVGSGYVAEAQARHPSAGIFRLITEFGFSDASWNTLRIADYYIDNPSWQRQAKLNGGEDTWINMAQNADQDWHIFRVSRDNAGTAGFRIDDNPAETTTENVPAVTMPMFLMSYGNTNQYVVDWARIRKWSGADPVPVVGAEAGLNTQWTGAVDSDWANPDNWTAGVPSDWTITEIQPSANIPVLNGSFNIGTDAILSLVPGAGLTINGDLINDGQLTIGSTLALSGSLIVTGTSTGSLTYNRQLKSGSTAGSDFHLVAPPVGSNTQINTGKISTVYQWSEITGTWTTLGITSILPGQAYNIRQEDASDGAIAFTGPIVSTDITVGASSPYTDAISPGDSYFDRAFAAGRSLTNLGGKGWNLLGNPYPSSISVDDFIAANYSSTPSFSQFDPNYVALYLFDGTARRYYYLANSTGWPSGLELNETHVQAGQGFFVLAMNDNSVFTFSRSMQEHSTGTPMLKSGGVRDNRWPGLQLKVNHETGEIFTTVVYNENMSAGVDPGYDIGLFRSGQALEIYTTMALHDNGVNYTRQALPIMGADTVILPIGVDFKKGGEVIFSATTLPVGNHRFWLEDRVTGIFTDLSTKSYTVTLPADTYGTGRFFIVASTNTPTSVREIQPGSDLRIWVSDDRLIIKGDVSEGALCEIYDMNGRILHETGLNEGELNTVSLPDGIHGVMFVKVSDGTKVTARKVVIL